MVAELPLVVFTDPQKGRDHFIPRSRVHIYTSWLILKHSELYIHRRYKFQTTEPRGHQLTSKVTSLTLFYRISDANNYQLRRSFPFHDSLHPFRLATSNIPGPFSELALAASSDRLGARSPPAAPHLSVPLQRTMGGRPHLARQKYSFACRRLWLLESE